LKAECPVTCNAWSEEESGGKFMIHPVQRLQANLRRRDKNGARKGPLAIFAEKLMQNISSEDEGQRVY
jgi:hypothetical protein